MAKGSETGSTFMAGVLAGLSPEDRQKGLEAWNQLSALGGGAVVASIGDGVLAQSEFSRQADLLREQQAAVEARQAEIDAFAAQQQQTYAQQTKWWKDNQERLKRLEEIEKANPTGVKPGSRQEEPVAGLTQEQLDAKLMATQQEFLRFTADKDDLAREHFAKFGTLLDFSVLYAHPQVSQIGLKGAYALQFKEPLETWEKTQKDKAEEAIRADERQKLRASQTSMPYPVGSDAIPGGSPLDALAPMQDQVVDKSVAHYHQILAERTAGRA